MKKMKENMLKELKKGMSHLIQIKIHINFKNKTVEMKSLLVELNSKLDQT